MASNSKPWTTKEIQDAKRAYLTGGSAAVVKLLPHRTRAAIQTQAQMGKWPVWTTIAEGSIAERIVKEATMFIVTASEMAAEIGRPVKNVSAIMCQLHKRKVLLRERLGDSPFYAYRVNPEWIEATADESK